MNRKTMWKAFLTIAPLTGVLAACAPTPADTLEPQASDPNATASSEDANSFPHTKEATGGQNGVTDTKQRSIEESQAGTPIEVAKMHGAQKVAYATLGALLADFGVPMTPTAAPPDDGMNNGPADGKGDDEGDATTVLATTAADLFAQGKSSLGAPVFGSRTPEMIVPSTSSLAKEFDIFIAAAPDIVTNIGSSKRCPGVVLVQNNALTEDGISCLIGKQATADHVTLANKLVTDSGDPKNGIPLAVATLLAAAHISE